MYLFSHPLSLSHRILDHSFTSLYQLNLSRLTPINPHSLFEAHCRLPSDPQCTGSIIRVRMTKLLHNSIDPIRVAATTRTRQSQRRSIGTFEEFTKDVDRCTQLPDISLRAIIRDPPASPFHPPLGRIPSRGSAFRSKGTLDPPLHITGRDGASEIRQDDATVAMLGTFARVEDVAGFEIQMADGIPLRLDLSTAILQSVM